MFIISFKQLSRYFLYTLLVLVFIRIQFCDPLVLVCSKAFALAYLCQYCSF